MKSEWLCLIIVLILLLVYACAITPKDVDFMWSEMQRTVPECRGKEKPTVKFYTEPFENKYNPYLNVIMLSEIATLDSLKHEMFHACGLEMGERE